MVKTRGRRREKRMNRLWMANKQICYKCRNAFESK
jgi:hypothetical protein